jgi:hypothetical protein
MPVVHMLCRCLVLFAAPLARANVREWHAELSKLSLSKDKGAALRHIRRPIVLEEHHHVLPYWYHAARHIKPSEKIALVHFDGEDDLRLPFAGQFGRSYLDESHWNRHMTRNDVFIMDSVARGLVDEIVWFTQAGDGGGFSSNVTIGKIIPQAGSPKEFTTHILSSENEDPYCYCWSLAEGVDSWSPGGVDERTADADYAKRRVGPFIESETMLSGEQVRCFYNANYLVGSKSWVKEMSSDTHAHCTALDGDETTSKAARVHFVHVPRVKVGDVVKAGGARGGKNAKARGEEELAAATIAANKFRALVSAGPAAGTARRKGRRVGRWKGGEGWGGGQMEGWGGGGGRVARQ